MGGGLRGGRRSLHCIRPSGAPARERAARAAQQRDAVRRRRGRLHRLPCAGRRGRARSGL